MRKYLLLVLFLSAGYTAFATTWTIINLGFTFSPASLTIVQGDTIVFALDDEHNAQQVSLNTWHTNGTTPLTGGFSVPLGGGMVLTDDLAEGTHFYVCQPHASMGMKGMIHVLTLGETTSTSEERAAAAMKVYPNPSPGMIHLSMNSNTPIENTQLAVYDVQGNKIDAISSLDGSQGQIDLTNVARGMYFIRFRHEGEMYTRKVITY